MPPTALTREQWTDEAFQELQRVFKPAEPPMELRWLHEWAASLCESYYDDGDCTPADAVATDLSYAD